MIHHPSRYWMPNFNVLLEGAWLVRDVKTEDDAIGVAISEAGKRLNQRKMDFVEVEMGQWDCPECKEPLAGVFLVASTALVALLFEIKIFNAESEEHAGRIAKSTDRKSSGNHTAPMCWRQIRSIKGPFSASSQEPGDLCTRILLLRRIRKSPVCPA